MKTNPTRLILLLPMMLLLASCSNEELENANVKLTEDLKKKDEELQKNKKELQTKIDDLQQQVDAATLLQEQIAILTNERDGLKAEQELNAQNMLETDVQMGVLQSELKDATIRIEDLTAEVKEANITISRLGSGVSQPPSATPAATTPTAPPFAPPVAGNPVGSTTTTPASIAPPAVATTPAFPTTPAIPIPTGPPTSTVPEPVTILTTPPPATPNGLNPLTTPAAAAVASLKVSVQLAIQGKTYVLPNCEIYITEKRPNISKWGLYLKNPSISHGNLQTIKASLQGSIIHEMATTDAQGQATFTGLESGNYFISTAHSATQRGLQWSVPHTVKPGQNVLVLSANNRLP